MAQTNAPQRRQFQDFFRSLASGYATASPTAIASGASGSVAITVPGVAPDGTWEVIAEFTNATNLNVAGVILSAAVTAANTVTMTIGNLSGGSITPTASSKYTVIVAKIADNVIV